MTRALVLALLAVLLVGAGDPAGTEVIVAFNGERFEPATVEVLAGARVTFHNMDARGEAYTVVADDGSFESRPLWRGNEWSHRFAVKGEHGFHLKERPETKGRAIVR